MQLQTALATSYTLERELGRGGMATVFLAQDLRHDRPVALKVLHPDLARTLGPERFQREVKLAARLQHPHILTVHDSGEAAGQLWFTMPYVEGESLRDRLRRERQLPVDAALRIATEAARALEYAHRHGVIHRDIKPENLMLTSDGSTLVADFGIARALAGVDDRLTETGLAVGTPAYMSPEQAAGDKGLDARTDVYSLGAVLYEMLAGEPPFTGPTAQAIIAKRFSGEVPRVRQARPSVPEHVDAAVSRALAPVAADRFETVEGFARALGAAATTSPVLATAPEPASVAGATAPRRATTPPPTPSTGRRVPLAAVTLVLGLIVGLRRAVRLATRASRADDSPGPRRRPAVLPFENLGDSADAYFADGITDEVRGKLSQVSGLAVIARAELERVPQDDQGPTRDRPGSSGRTTCSRPRSDGRKPAAARAGSGSVPSSSGSSRVPRRPPSGSSRSTPPSPMCSRCKRTSPTKVASALNVALGDSVRHELAAKATENLAAYDAYLKGEAASQALAGGFPPACAGPSASTSRRSHWTAGFVPAWAQLARARSSCIPTAPLCPSWPRRPVTRRTGRRRWDLTGPKGSWR